MKLAVAQFQPKNGDKSYNLSVIAKLSAKAKTLGAQVISFHEMCITAYTYTKDLSLHEITSLSEEVPNGQSTQNLINIAYDLDMVILAGLIERDGDALYNSYVCVNEEGLVAKYRKLHPFISPHLSPGNDYCVFDLMGWKCGILICYDNNIVENVRATSLLGAELIFAPHVTGCTPSSMPGRGFVDDALWQNRAADPEPLRLEFDGPKGRSWLMRWLPARAYDNGVYFAFTNPIGYDGEHLKNGNSMIIDPYGEILAEIKSFKDEITVAEITKDKIPLSGGMRYRKARRPELYKHIIGKAHSSSTKPIWMKNKPDGNS